MHQLLRDSEETESEPDNEESDCPVLGGFVEYGGSGAVMEMSNFFILEFDGVWRIIEQPVRAQYERGRGRKSGSAPNDVHFMFLSTLKLGGKWDFNRRIFEIKKPTFERMVIRFSNNICPLLFEKLLNNYRSSFKMSPLAKEVTTLKKKSLRSMLLM